MKKQVKLSFPYLQSLRKAIFFRFIPQWTVDTNLGPDRLAGTKALDPNHCRQLILTLHDLCIEVIIVHGIELCLFEAKAFPLLFNIGHLTYY